jgi:hypothetical protein
MVGGDGRRGSLGGAAPAGSVAGSTLAGSTLVGSVLAGSVLAGRASDAETAAWRLLEGSSRVTIVAGAERRRRRA